MAKPQQGQIVMFVWQTGVYRPAMITIVNADGTVNLNVFHCTVVDGCGTTPICKANVINDPNNSVGTWH